MYPGLPKERGNTFFKMTGRFQVLVDGNLELNDKITKLHKEECLFLYLQVFSSFGEVKSHIFTKINIC